MLIYKDFPLKRYYTYQLLLVCIIINMFMNFSAYAEPVIYYSGVYDGAGTTTETSEVAQWLNTDVAKTFDGDGNDWYGTSGFLHIKTAGSWDGQASWANNAGNWGYSGTSTQGLGNYMFAYAGKAARGGYDFVISGLDPNSMYELELFTSNINQRDTYFTVNGEERRVAHSSSDSWIIAPNELGEIIGIFASSSTGGEQDWAGMALRNYDTNAVPEPATWAMMVLGTFGIFWYQRRRKG